MHLRRKSKPTYLPVELVELEKVHLMPVSKRSRVSVRSKVKMKLFTWSRVKANI